ncbi:TetR/AcrR family transcriptional regulator C-terminal domain-containing protein [Leucobacter sp. CSA2]|uniref:TetR/AcrR family transcriptional regulator C-terminal domain-containing protein n=2 Tax=Leucobacter edaphi TaxID=2796472 RepID=A0A934QFB7_9MICO|nr:TetR/AcrR family transcriptional regulator C-terminal domain-containing protein [Leucobacter edaphi]
MPGTEAGDTPGAASEPPVRRRAGRPRTGILSRKLILETGLRLIDERGADGAGMRAIAHELGVGPSALYNHVGGQAELMAGIRELISDRIGSEMFADLPWDQALEAWAHRYRAAFAAHPPTIAMLAVLPLSADSITTVMYEDVIAKLVGAGWPPARALELLVALEAFILGAALDLAADPDMMNPGPRGDVPAYSAAYAARAARIEETGTSAADASFALGLRAMLAGFRAELAGLSAADE